MTRNLVPALLTIVTTMILALASTQPVRGELPPLPIRLRTFAVNMSNNLTGANAILEITIDRWSSNEQRARLLDTVPKGQDALVDALQKAPINGRIRIPGGPGRIPTTTVWVGICTTPTMRLFPTAAIRLFSPPTD